MQFYSELIMKYILINGFERLMFRKKKLNNSLEIVYSV